VALYLKRQLGARRRQALSGYGKPYPRQFKRLLIATRLTVFGGLFRWVTWITGCARTPTAFPSRLIWPRVWEELATACLEGALTRHFASAPKLMRLSMDNADRVLTPSQKSAKELMEPVTFMTMQKKVYPC